MHLHGETRSPRHAVTLSVDSGSGAQGCLLVHPDERTPYARPAGCLPGGIRIGTTPPFPSGPAVYLRPHCVVRNPEGSEANQARSSLRPRPCRSSLVLIDIVPGSTYLRRSPRMLRSLLTVARSAAYPRGVPGARSCRTLYDSTTVLQPEAPGHSYRRRYASSSGWHARCTKLTRRTTRPRRCERLRLFLQ